MPTSQQTEDAENARHRAHVAAGDEYAAAHPDFNPWDTSVKHQDDHAAYVAGRVPQILSGGTGAN